MLGVIAMYPFFILYIPYLRPLRPSTIPSHHFFGLIFCPIYQRLLQRLQVEYLLEVVYKIESNRFDEKIMPISFTPSRGKRDECRDTIIFTSYPLIKL